MASSSSSSSAVPEAAPVAVEAGKTGVYSEEEVRLLREQGIEAEKQDKWEEAAEAYSRALEKCCPDFDQREAVVARGFDPLLANLMYLYGTALLYTYTQNTGMFGDKADEEVKKRAEALEGGKEKDERLNAELANGIVSDELLDELMAGLVQGEEVGEEEEEEEQEEEEINADDVYEEERKNQEGEGERKQEEEGEDGEGVKAGEEDNDEAGGEGIDGEDEEGEEDDGEAGSEQNGDENDVNHVDQQPEQNDLELAWMVLEIARVLYATQPDRSLELSDVHFSLGNVAWEDEKLDEAKVEFEKALNFAEAAKERRAQAQVLLMLSSVHESKNDMETATQALERSKKLLRDEITKLRATNPKDIAIEILESSIAEIDSRIFSLNDKFVAANPEDVKDLPDPSKGPLTYSFTAPQIQSSSGPSSDIADASDASRPINIIQPRKKQKKEDDLEASAKDIALPPSNGTASPPPSPVPIANDTSSNHNDLPPRRADAKRQRTDNVGEV